MVDEIECVLSVLLAIIFAHLIGAQNISWAAFSGYLVMRGHFHDSLRRGTLRIVGTSAGAAIAIVTYPFIARSPIAFAAAILLIGCCSLYAALTHRHAYAFLSIGLTFVMIVLEYPQSPGALRALASTRILEVFAGTSACVMISTVSALTVRRQWPGERQLNLFVTGWHADTARHAAQGGLALCLLPLIHVVWPLPELSQAAIAITALMLVPVNRLGSSVLMPASRRIGLRFLGMYLWRAAVAGLTLFVSITWRPNDDLLATLVSSSTKLRDTHVLIAFHSVIAQTNARHWGRLQACNILTLQARSGGVNVVGMRANASGVFWQPTQEVSCRGIV